MQNLIFFSGKYIATEFWDPPIQTFWGEERKDRICASNSDFRLPTLKEIFELQEAEYNNYIRFCPFLHVGTRYLWCLDVPYAVGTPGQDRDKIPFSKWLPRVYRVKSGGGRILLIKEAPILDIL